MSSYNELKAEYEEILNFPGFESIPHLLEHIRHLHMYIENSSKNKTAEIIEILRLGARLEYILEKH